MTTLDTRAVDRRRRDRSTGNIVLVEQATRTTVATGTVDCPEPEG